MLWVGDAGSERRRPAKALPARVAPHVATIPGVAIMLAVLGFNLLGDGLREALDPRLGRVVELRFFAGLSVEESAAALDVSEITVKRGSVSAPGVRSTSRRKKLGRATYSMP